MNNTTGAVSFLVSTPSGVQAVFTGGSTPTLTEQAAYSIWGVKTIQSGSNTTPFGYQGSYALPSGLIYLINRYYDPTTAQFLSIDPALAQTGQPYSFTGNDPLNATDPNGARGWYCIGGQTHYYQGNKFGAPNGKCGGSSGSYLGVIGAEIAAAQAAAAVSAYLQAVQQAQLAAYLQAVQAAQLAAYLQDLQAANEQAASVAASTSNGSSIGSVLQGVSSFAGTVGAVGEAADLAEAPTGILIPAEVPSLTVTVAANVISTVAGCAADALNGSSLLGVVTGCGVDSALLLGSAGLVSSGALHAWVSSASIATSIGGDIVHYGSNVLPWNW